MDPKVKSFAISTLRRATYRWKPRDVAKKAAKVSRGLYTCNVCKKVVRDKDKELDHIIPVVPISGWVSFDSFIERLFCSQENYQVICTPCHIEKSAKEGSVRKTGKKRLTKKKKVVKV